MSAIFKREFMAYFTSPLGYVFCAIFLFVFNLLFFFIVIGSQSSDLAPLFSGMLLFTMLLIPVLTMRLLAEDFKLKTDQLLMCAPVRLSSIVLGKFFAGICVFLTGLAFTLIYLAIIPMLGGNLLAASTFGNYAAYIALAAAYFAIGMFISSLTESQVVAGVATWGVFLGLYILDIASAMFPDGFIKEFVGWISMFSRYETFARGVFSLADFVYYLSVCAVFLFLTVRILEKRRRS